MALLGGRKVQTSYLDVEHSEVDLNIGDNVSNTDTLSALASGKKQMHPYQNS